jgi:hypothetical protein
MSRVVRSLNGAGRLLLRGGETLAGRYHIDVVFLPVRRVHSTQGSFVLDDAPAWESVVEAQFAGEATLVTADGQELKITLGGILGSSVTIVDVEPVSEV